MKHYPQRERKQPISAQCAVPKFCSMRISQDIRNYAKEKDLNTTEAIHQGMKEKAQEFKKAGSRLYQ